LTLHLTGWSNVSCPSAVVKLVQEADAVAVPGVPAVPGVLGEPGVLAVPGVLGEPVAVGSAVLVSAAVGEVTVGLGLDVVVGPACGPQPVNSKAIRMAVGITAPDAAGLRITPSFGAGSWSLNCRAGRPARIWRRIDWRRTVAAITKGSSPL
jgi:hypothetical protein